MFNCLFIPLVEWLSNHVVYYYVNVISYPCPTVRWLNTLRPRQNGRHFADDIFMCIFFSENWCILVKFSLKYVRKGPIDDNPALVEIMAWRRSGDKPLSQPMMTSLPTHICVTRPQWLLSYLLAKPTCVCSIQSFYMFLFTTLGETKCYHKGHLRMAGSHSCWKILLHPKLILIMLNSTQCNCIHWRTVFAFPSLHNTPCYKHGDCMSVLQQSVKVSVMLNPLTWPQISPSHTRLVIRRRTTANRRAENSYPHGDQLKTFSHPHKRQCNMMSCPYNLLNIW